MATLSTQVTTLDENGVIVETNRAWQNLAHANGMSKPVDCVGLNYLTICDNGSCNDSEGRLISRAIRQMIRARRNQGILTQYPCHSPTEQRWYSLRVVPYRDQQTRWVIVTHENVMPIKMAQEKLRWQEKELQQKMKN